MPRKKASTTIISEDNDRINTAIISLQKAFRQALNILPAVNEIHEALQKIYYWKAKKLLLDSQTLYAVKDLLLNIETTDVWKGKTLKQTFGEIIRNLKKAEDCFSELYDKYQKENKS